MTSTVLRITIGAGRMRPQGSTVEIQAGDTGPVHVLAEHLRALPPDDESWWMPYEFEGGYRQGTNWRSACGIAIDADYGDREGAHTALPAAVEDEVNAAVKTGAMVGSLYHPTPRGIRIIFVFAVVVTDPERRRRCALGAAAAVTRALSALNLSRSDSQGGLSVDTSALDDARCMYTPNAIVHGVHRSGEVLVICPTPVDPEVLVAEAPPEPEEVVENANQASAAGASTEFESAVAAYNKANPRTLPPSSGKCPACGHEGCFGQLAEDATRWACFSDNHEKDSRGCGLKGEKCWHGDALDLDAHEAGLSLAQVLRGAGYLVEKEVAGGGESPMPGQSSPATATFDREAEVALLACLLKDRDLSDAACASVGGISASDFFDAKTRKIYLAMLDIEARKGRPDPLSLRIALEGKGAGDALDGVLAALPGIPVENAVILAKRVRECSKFREEHAALESIRQVLDRSGPLAIARIRSICDQAVDDFAPQGATASTWGWRTPEEISSSEDSKVDWIVPNLIARQHVTVLYAKPKLGKTKFLVTGILAPLSRGEGALGHPAPAAPILSVVLSEEAAGRWRAHIKSSGLRDGRILTRGKFPAGLPFAEVMDQVGRYAASVGAAIVVVDTLTAFAGLAGDAENDAGKMGEAIEPILRAAATHNVAFVLIHHVRKWTKDSDPADVDLLRGSGNFAAKVDFLANFTKPSDARDKYRQRQLFVGGRLDEVEPYSIVVEYVPGSPDRYRVVGAAEAANDPELQAEIHALLVEKPLNATCIVKEVERRKADVLAQLQIMLGNQEIRCLKREDRPKGMNGKVFAPLAWKLESDPPPGGAK